SRGADSAVVVGVGVGGVVEVAESPFFFLALAFAAVSLGVATTVVISVGVATGAGGVVDESEPPLFLLALAFGFGVAS
nr:hypothetical protein [Tanacetum cinerariifolium]